MTKEQFEKLKGGDILLMRSGAIRTIVQGPRDLVRKRGPWTPSVTFIKLTRGLYGPTTVYFWTDLHRKIKAVMGRTKAVCLKAEVLRLKHMGWEPREEFNKAVKEEIRTAKRRGWKLCPRLKQLKKSWKLNK